MKITSIQLHQWKLELEQYSKEYEVWDREILKVYGIGSNNPLFVKKFINSLCRKGRNSDKFELNNMRFMNILAAIAQKNSERSAIYYLVNALLKSLQRVKIIYSRQGSINVARKIFLMPNVAASITLKRAGALARTLVPAAFATEIMYANANDQKSKLIAGTLDVVKLAKAAAE